MWPLMSATRKALGKTCFQKYFEVLNQQRNVRLYLYEFLVIRVYIFCFNETLYYSWSELTSIVVAREPQAAFWVLD